MLIITRKHNESVTLYDEFGKKLGDIIISSIRGGRVRMGFEFPKKIRALRSELKLQ